MRISVQEAKHRLAQIGYTCRDHQQRLYPWVSFKCEIVVVAITGPIATLFVSNDETVDERDIETLERNAAQ